MDKLQYNKDKIIINTLRKRECKSLIKSNLLQTIRSLINILLNNASFVQR